MRHLTVLLIMLMLVGAASAAMTYNIGAGSSIDVHSVDPGLRMGASINPGLDSLSYTLAEGESSEWFTFATVWPEEGWVNFSPGDDDDIQPKTATAYLDLDSPAGLYSISGETVGTIIQNWQITWDSPVLYGFGNGGQFQIEMCGASATVWMLDPPSLNTADVCARITHISDSSDGGGGDDVIPAPGALLLASLGGLGVSLLRTRRSF